MPRTKARSSQMDPCYRSLERSYRHRNSYLRLVLNQIKSDKSPSDNGMTGVRSSLPTLCVLSPTVVRENAEVILLVETMTETIPGVPGLTNLTGA